MILSFFVNYKNIANGHLKPWIYYPFLLVQCLGTVVDVALLIHDTNGGNIQFNCNMG